MILDGPTARRSHESRLCPSCGAGKCAGVPLCHRCKRRIGGAKLGALHYAALDHRDDSDTYARCLCGALDQLGVSEPVLSDTIEVSTSVPSVPSDQSGPPREHAGVRVGPASDEGARKPHEKTRRASGGRATGLPGGTSVAVPQPVKRRVKA